MIFETERLQLRPTSEEDADFIYKLFNTPDWIEYIGDRNIHSTTEARSYIKAKMMPQFKRLGFGNYTVIHKSDGAKIGSCGLYDREGLTDIDIGFAFLSEYGKQGYAYEAAFKLKEIAFQQFNLVKLIAITRKENLSSQKLLKKLGLYQTGTVVLPGEAVELVLFSVSKSSS
ncbi:GNAT family N-acetyltransferase [Zobellia barbeyronii]|uniref:GNAT family N-acetyltransferase n=1 Tax=Zobellia barbeyronii TaxID=2748009 RepID=A0ABS5WEA6_9FLAO|nr:GNAT family N-acetyltransferase [Zobellia barbeyronii]MBT2161736.1 GNAT family N-acetyltransferase [Zobellia barbeyronii]